jgi:hypothetical protein
MERLCMRDGERLYFSRSVLEFLLHSLLRAQNSYVWCIAFATVVSRWLVLVLAVFYEICMGSVYAVVVPYTIRVVFFTVVLFF